jgi:hypothetical protein
MNRSGQAVLCGVVLVALLGCKTLKRKLEDRVKEETVAATGPISLNWEQPYKLTVQGTKAEGTFFPTKEPDKPPLRLQASFHGFPKGTKLKIGPDETTVGDGGYWSTLIDIKPAVLKHSLDDLKGPIDLDLELRVEVPGAPVAMTKLQKQDVKEGLRAALARARDGGVTFGAGDEAGRKARGAAVLSGYSDLDFIGAAKALHEVDWVVIAEDQKEPRATKTCPFKQGPATLKLFDASATVIERRTGKTLAERVLKAGSECPMFAFISKEDNSAKNNVQRKDVVAYARAELAKAK